MKSTPDNPPPAEETIHRIESSLRCFVFSLLGLIPFVGLPFSVAALLRTRALQRRTGTAFNPADRYLKAASRLAPLGFLITGAALLLCVVVPAILNDFSGGSGGG